MATRPKTYTPEFKLQAPGTVRPRRSTSDSDDSASRTLAFAPNETS